jgi:hypothetical protein
MILNVKIHCKEVFYNVRNWSFDKKNNVVPFKYRHKMFQLFCQKIISMTFWVPTYCTDLRYPWFGPKMHIFDCRLHNSSQSKGVFCMANLKILVRADSRALLTLCRGSQIARLTTFRTQRIFVWRSSKKWGWKAMIFNVKIHRKEVFFTVRNWSFDIGPFKYRHKVLQFCWYIFISMTFWVRTYCINLGYASFWQKVQISICRLHKLQIWKF